MATLIDGKRLAQLENDKTERRVAALRASGITPGLAVILVGDDPASQVYVRSKQRKARELGIYSVQTTLPATAQQAEVAAVIDAYNHDERIHAILVQSPLPAHLDEQALVAMIDPAKDVDGFHPLNVGKLYNHLPGHYPVACTPRGIITMLDTLNFEYAGARAVIVGRSILVGRPLQALLVNRNATVTMIGRRTKAAAALMKTADLLVVAVGQPQLVTAAMVKPGAVVIDVGINRLADGHLVGDVDFAAVEPLAQAITPVPGGVGPMTIASLMTQTVDLAEWSQTDA